MELWWHGRVSKRAMKTIFNAAAKKGLVAVNGEEVQLMASLPSIEPALCPPLQALVSQLELEHPHFPLPDGTADPTAGRTPWRIWNGSGSSPSVRTRSCD